MLGRDTYVVVRTHGLSTHLVPEERLRAWALIEDDSRLLSEIAPTEYGPFFDSTGDLRDPEAIEEKSSRVLGLRIRRVISISSGPVGRLVRTYAARFDLENLRRIVYALTMGKGGGKSALLPLGGFLLDTEVIAKAEEVGELPQILREPEVRSAVERWISSGDRDLAKFDVWLDVAHADMLSSAAASTGDPKIGEMVREVNERRLLSTALKLHYEGRDAAEFSEYFKGRMRRHVLEAIFGAKDLRDAITRLSGLGEYKSVALLMSESLEKTGEPWVMELALLRDAVTEVRRVASRAPLAYPYVFGYVVECEWEWTRFKTLLLGRASGMLGPELYDLLAPGYGQE